MKYIFLCFIFFSTSVFSIRKNPICVNRGNKVVAHLTSPETIKIKYDSKIQNLNIQKIYGVDELNVLSYRELETVMNNEINLEIKYSVPDKLAYILINVTYQEVVQGVTKDFREIVTLEVGKLSTEQKKARRKNVKKYKLSGSSNEGNRITDKTISVQELPLIRK